MDSNAFKGSGRRLGSYSESIETTNGVDSHVNPRTKIEGKDQKPTRLLSRLVAPITTMTPVEGQKQHNKETSDTVPPAMADVVLVPDSPTTKKRKRRASTASTASLPDPGQMISATKTAGSPVQKHLKGEEIVELLTDEDRQQWMEWLEQKGDQVDPLQILETWYHSVRPQNQIAASSVSTTRTEFKNRLKPSGDLEPHSNLTNIDPVLPKTGSLSDTTPGRFRHPVILKTWCFGYPRERDIKLAEVLQKDHLSSVVISSFGWDLDFWWSKINRDTTPCQFIMQRDHLQPGTRLQDGANRIILHPEGTKIQHSKFMLLFFEELKELRLVITSANMFAYDWGEMGGFEENIVFVVDLPKTRNQDLTQFGNDFSQHCLSLGLGVNIVNQFKEYDWELTRDLIFIAAQGQATVKELPSTGLAGLSQKLAQAGLTHDGEIEIDYVASSIGKLNWEFLSYLYQACKGKGPLPSPARCKNQCTPEELTNNIRVYFASQHTVDGSKGGRQYPNSLCLYPTNYYSLGEEEKKVLHDCVSRRPGCLMHSKILFVQPKSSNSSNSTVNQSAQARRWSENPHRRSPITQSAAEKTSADSNADREKHETSSIARQVSPAPWVYVGSANCSWAGWGNPKNYRKQEASYNTGSNWECGVIIPIRTVQNGHNLDRLDIFSTVLPVPMRTDTESLHPQNRRPFFPSPPEPNDFQPREGLI